MNMKLINVISYRLFLHGLKKKKKKTINKNENETKKQRRHFRI